MGQIINKSKNTIIAQTYQTADSFFPRMIGLLNRSSLHESDALVITQCNSIHMFFMRFAIDAIFADKNDCVVGLVKDIKPFFLSKIFFKASYVIELAVGSIESSQTEIGDQLHLQ